MPPLRLGNEPLQCVSTDAKRADSRIQALDPNSGALLELYWPFSGTCSGVGILSDEQEAPPLTGRAKGRANQRIENESWMIF